ncbi:hypothetical protein BS50DRAFT_577048 [Corynespora cassiicola Philippines]|uniref:Uncharacterized protein n=1 Tax=Corynespora cassiicola Philippines TaxID=1448308 RepID=A0A2T2NCY5_CORCC|nr:hypothetical protein BS50DRAFT_577048 [Corynespora cassiicola Philippines]
MQFRFYTFAQAFRGSGAWAGLNGSRAGPRITQFVCRTCQHKFSTSAILRKAAQATKSLAKNVQKKTKAAETRYSRNLLIYDAGDTRTAFVTFWKATAIFQFGTCTIFLVPMLYNNQNQPDENIRLLQAAGVFVLGAIPSLTMAYLTSPFVKKVFMEIPEWAQKSRSGLLAFARNPPGDTRINFVTLRTFPFEHNTSVFLSELRALPPQKGRFANIELPKSLAWRQRQKEKSLANRIWDVVKEQRFKFYVKEGRAYTMKTGVPGVWESIAEKIQQQTSAEAANSIAKGAKPLKPVKQAAPVKLVADRERQKAIKRQTARSAR